MRDFWGTLCTSVKQIKAPYLFDFEQGITLHAMQGIGPHLSSSGTLMVFLELQREAGVCSRVTAGVDIKNFCFFSDVRTPVYLRWTPQDSKLDLAGHYGHFWR